MFTQPLMYSAASSDASVGGRNLFEAASIEEDVVTAEDVDNDEGRRSARSLEEELKAAACLQAQQGRLARRAVGRLSASPIAATSGRGNTGVSARKAEGNRQAQDHRRAVRLPRVHKIDRQAASNARREGDREGRGHRLGDGRGSAFGTLMQRGLPGAPLRPGLRARHLLAAPFGAVIDQEDESRYTPFNHLARRTRGATKSSTRLLSEEAVLGFEYGYSLAEPNALSMLGSPVRRFRQRRAGGVRPVHLLGRAQVAAHVRSDLLCCRTATKARDRSIPSARLERFLQMCAEDNMQVANLHDACELLP